MTDINFDIKPSELSEKDKLNFLSLWEKYNLEIIGLFNNKYKNRINNDLEQKNYFTGKINQEEVDEVLSIIKNYSSKVKFSNDSDISFINTDFENLGLEEDYNRDSNFYELNFLLQFSINKILDRIKMDIANQLGAPWRNLMIRIWETKSDAKKENMYGWHTDGMPHEFFKIMLYFNVLNKNNGTLELKTDNKEKILESSDPGTYVLFKNSMIFHRGIAPQENNIKRYACEVTICRSFNFFTSSLNAGNNAHYPISPWYQAMVLNNLTKKEYKKNIIQNKDLIFNEIKNNHYEKLKDNQRKLAQLISNIKTLAK